MTREEFIAIANAKYDKLEQTTDTTDYYKYELGLFDLMQEFGQAVMEKELGEVDLHSKKKSSFNSIWQNNSCE
jgi:hypothetical protein